MSKRRDPVAEEGETLNAADLALGPGHADAAATSEVALLAQAIASGGAGARSLKVALSNELVELLSTQLYQSPVKAVEELVVNAYDAGADVCRVFIPFGSAEPRLVVVFDNGSGMDYDGLVDLWHIGRSGKPEIEAGKRLGRKTIGKFGIGKLATYVIARYVTYVTRVRSSVLAVSLDFERFKPSARGATELVELQVRPFTSADELLALPAFQTGCEAVDVTASKLFGEEQTSWTMVLLEELKPKARTLRAGTARWVLSTAMPLRSNFNVWLNGGVVESAKAGEPPLVSFRVSELSNSRREALAKADGALPGVVWSVVDDRLVADQFPEGVAGEVLVTAASLYGGKSDDLERSNGFFVRVRGRLVNTRDALFGLHPLAFGVWNRFRADINADDLYVFNVAAREGLTEHENVACVRRLLLELFYEARDRYEAALKLKDDKELRKREEHANLVAPALVEHPIADALAMRGSAADGAEPDGSWFYLQVSNLTDVPELVSSLYSEERRRFKFRYRDAGREERMAILDPRERTFTLNTDHELIREYVTDPRAEELLFDLVTAEVLLEVYLRESDIPSHVAGEILERRDRLFRRLAQEHATAPSAIARELREAAASERELELALVTAVRALGFVAKHVSGAGEPDGIASFLDHQVGERRITLEAKSSQDTPQLSQLDFAGLQEHMTAYEAQGCLLVAPAYPGEARGESSAVAERANQQRVSCWTVEQLARVVEMAEARHITTSQILGLVTAKFAPADVKAAVEELLSTPSWDMRELYRGIIRALRALDARLKGTPRSVEMVATEVSREEAFSGISHEEVQQAVRQLAAGSQGGMVVAGEGTAVILSVAYDELERRVTQLTAQEAGTRRPSNFRER